MMKTIDSSTPGRTAEPSGLGPAEGPQAERSEAVGPGAGPNPAHMPPDPQVPEKAKRRRFTADYKKRILVEADRCSGQGAIGALLRREGLYSSHLTNWRQQQIQGLQPAKRGRKSTRNPLEEENRRLRRENLALEGRLKRAEVILDIQKKVSEILGIPLNTPEIDGGDS